MKKHPWTLKNIGKYVSIRHVLVLQASDKVIATQLAILALNRLANATPRSFITGRKETGGGGGGGGQISISSRLSDWVATILKKMERARIF